MTALLGAEEQSTSKKALDAARHCWPLQQSKAESQSWIYGIFLFAHDKVLLQEALPSPARPTCGALCIRPTAGKSLGNAAPAIQAKGRQGLQPKKVNSTPDSVHARIRTALACAKAPHKMLSVHRFLHKSAHNHRQLSGCTHTREMCHIDLNQYCSFK